MPPPIRPATVTDLAAINAIYNHYVLHSTCTYQLSPSTELERQAWFARHGPAYPVTVAAEPGGMVLGWASLSAFLSRPAYRFTVEDSVYVHPDHLRRGIGRALLVDLLRRADELGYANVIANISADQAPSITVHRELGFVEAGRLVKVGFKFERWLDIVFLQRRR